MNSKRAEELEEQYEDAVLALLMNDYAEQKGNLLLQEYEDAMSNGEAPEIPADLDAKCQKMIRQECAKSQRKKAFIRIFRSVSRAAVYVLVVLGICTTLVLSVDALRIPVLNFIIAQTDKYTSIGNTDGTQPSDDVIETIIDPQKTDDGSPLAGLLPDEFALKLFQTYDDGTFTYYYEDSESVAITFLTKKAGEWLNTDTEHSTCEAIEFNSHEGLFVQKDSVLKVIWFDADNQLIYQLSATNMDIADFWALVIAFEAIQ